MIVRQFDCLDSVVSPHPVRIHGRTEFTSFIHSGRFVGRRASAASQQRIANNDSFRVLSVHGAVSIVKQLFFPDSKRFEYTTQLIFLNSDHSCRLA